VLSAIDMLWIAAALDLLTAGCNRYLAHADRCRDAWRRAAHDPCTRRRAAVGGRIVVGCDRRSELGAELGGRATPVEDSPLGWNPIVMAATPVGLDLALASEGAR
jgi:hypothetical protein